jgi:hypothetical protein
MLQFNAWPSLKMLGYHPAFGFFAWPSLKMLGYHPAFGFFVLNMDFRQKKNFYKICLSINTLKSLRIYYAKILKGY